MPFHLGQGEKNPLITNPPAPNLGFDHLRSKGYKTREPPRGFKFPSEQFPKETPAKRIPAIKIILDLNPFPLRLMEYQDTKIPDQNQSSEKKF